ncbi:3-hydroxyacyl-ACP dehydratase FabZ [Olsenella sp. Marseille-P4559]|uniref:3-hydroxyacyl-ACP dehydratase FabZ n=1 Tax=Olsenella sp. Marseille-P4559 TaxID=2364795 RepID=UPI00102FE6A6|nr:3-hydroxyacyl-ACP dehydratase FabZ [Olsenella sp. Marseille-P4559]
MNREDIEAILPHRPPMLLVDDCELVGGHAIGHTHVTGDEFFVRGHFPGNPVVPGVILCEMLAQNCCVLLAQDGSTQGATPYYTSLDKVRFKHPVCPGDTVELDCTVTRSHGMFHFAHGEARVGQTICCIADMSFALVPEKDV